MTPRPRPVMERFWEKVNKNGPCPPYRPELGPCWLWKNNCRDGYGTFSHNDKTRKAHRVSWMAANGPIPKGLQIDHLCRVTNCVNPAHLEAVTPRENTMRSGAVSAICARKTHCVHGHPFSGENLKIRRNGSRSCKTCERMRSRGEL